MSWQAYVDTNLVGSGKVTKAAILGQQGGVWATSAGYNITDVEQKAILAALSNPDSALASGLKLAGVKFLTVKADDRSIIGKQGPKGYTIVGTKQAVLVAEYDAPTQAQESTLIVEGLADYLIGLSY
ncbi:profilin [Roridomyces roridus]|uniref:Profilin n=1 Tax=Roridomyces roridus TaxID=1738132 RepID=A0AAD7FI68_9AGAR|nr:profilin [Roridomyces roridus]